jgi:hypothetical protein
MLTKKVLLKFAVNKSIATVESLDKPSLPEDSIVRQNMAAVLEEHDKNLPRLPASYRRIVKAAREDAEADLELKPKGSFKPFLEG